MRKEKTQLFQQHQNNVCIDMTMENEDAEMLDYTFSVITAAFFLLELVERVSNMLNYLFSQMVGPQQKTLTLKDLEKYEFKPKQLLNKYNINCRYSNCISC